MRDTTRTLIILHLAVFLAGWTGIFGRLVSLGGLPLVWYRIMVSVVTLALVLALTGRLHRVGRKALLQIGGCGILLALHWTCFFASIQASNVSIGVACIATTCFFTAVFNPLIDRLTSLQHRVAELKVSHFRSIFLRRKCHTEAQQRDIGSQQREHLSCERTPLPERSGAIDWREIIISFISIAGVLLVFSLDVRYRVGIAWGLLSAAIYSVFAILNVNVARRTGEPTDTMLLYELVGGVLFLTLCIPLYVKILPDAGIVPSARDLLWLLLLGSVFTVIPFLFQLQALRKLSAFTVNLTYNLEPVYSIAIAAVLFGEQREVGWSFWVGLALIVISVLLQTRRLSQ